MNLISGIVKTANYESLLKDNLFYEMENFSDNFLKKNKFILKPYLKKWSKDPLHEWSRQWEYPYVFSKLLEYTNENDKINIIDAGSGVTFFPYYIISRFKNADITCYDYDTSYKDMYLNLNKNLNTKVNFETVNLQELPYKNNSTDVIYSISVLEHTINYEQILQEFKRILTPEGKLIITFDISLDGKNEMPIDKVDNLLKMLANYFNPIENKTLKINEEISSYTDILTTHYYNNINKFTLMNLFKKDKPRKVRKFKENLTCYCGIYSNK